MWRPLLGRNELFIWWKNDQSTLLEYSWQWPQLRTSFHDNGIDLPKMDKNLSSSAYLFDYLRKHEMYTLIKVT